jgi:non-lysosomal glucosylceramidase
LSALRSLWKYNFVPDAGPFRERFPRGRWYAMAGDAGLLMCTWPRGGQNPGFKDHWQYMYFNECMSGFEWQAAAHMIWESHDQPDLLEKGLAIARAIDDRYSATLRNPYNEIECSDHYARAMASYGVYQAVCGFHCHGPRGHIGLAPRLQAQRFQAAFVGPEGWGTYEQSRDEIGQRISFSLRWGRLDLETIRCTLHQRFLPIQVKVRIGGDTVDASPVSGEGKATVTLARRTTIDAGQRLDLELT